MLLPPKRRRRISDFWLRESAAHVVFTDEQWPTATTLGRVTISPDHVAVKAFQGGPFELILLYHDGNIVPNPQSNSFYTALVRNQAQEIEEMRLLVAATRSPAIPKQDEELSPPGIELPRSSGW